MRNSIEIEDHKSLDSIMREIHIYIYISFWSKGGWGVRLFIVFEMAFVVYNITRIQPGLYGIYGYIFIWVCISKCNYIYICDCMHALLYVYIRIFPITCLSVAFLHV